MSESKHGSAGGKARALLQKEEAKQRIDEYNQNPNLCLCCNKPILAPYDKKLHKTKIKKFCSRSCAAKFNNCNSKKVKNVSGFNGTIPLICTKTDEEIIEAFNNSNYFTVEKGDIDTVICTVANMNAKHYIDLAEDLPNITSLEITEKGKTLKIGSNYNDYDKFPQNVRDKILAKGWLITQ